MLPIVLLCVSTTVVLSQKEKCGWRNEQKSPSCCKGWFWNQKCGFPAKDFFNDCPWGEVCPLRTGSTKAGICVADIGEAPARDTPVAECQTPQDLAKNAATSTGASLVEGIVSKADGTKNAVRNGLGLNGKLLEEVTKTLNEICKCNAQMRCRENKLFERLQCSGGLPNPYNNGDPYVSGSAPTDPTVTTWGGDGPYSWTLEGEATGTNEIKLPNDQNLHEAFIAAALVKYSYDIRWSCIGGQFQAYPKFPRVFSPTFVDSSKNPPSKRAWEKISIEDLKTDSATPACADGAPKFIWKTVVLYKETGSKQCMLVMPGSSDCNDWVIDGQVSTAKPPTTFSDVYADKALVHHGFSTLADKFWIELLADNGKMRETMIQQCTSVSIVGHSLSSGVFQLLVPKISMDDKLSKIVTGHYFFAAPASSSSAPLLTDAAKEKIEELSKTWKGGVYTNFQGTSDNLANPPKLQIDPVVSFSLVGDLYQHMEGLKHYFLFNDKIVSSDNMRAHYHKIDIPTVRQGPSVGYKAEIGHDMPFYVRKIANSAGHTLEPEWRMPHETVTVETECPTARVV